MIITIDRECGCEGHAIGRLVADHYHIALIDRDYLKKLAEENHIYDQLENFFEERPVDSFLYSIAMNGEFPKTGRKAAEVLRDALAGMDFVMIGRCGNFIFQDAPDAVSIYLHATRDQRIRSVMKRDELNWDAASRRLATIDEQREHFHRYYTGHTWGLACHYDLCLNVTQLRHEMVAKMIIDFTDNYSKMVDLTKN